MTLGSQQIPQWNHTGTLEQHQKDNSERAGEEFLRCLATNQPFPDYLKGNMSYNLADALKSANALKAAVSTDPEFQKHIIKSKSRSRSRGRSRAKSRARSKSRVRSRSRGRSRSKGRSTSRSRAKSRARSKSRAPSRSRGKSRARSKSRGRSRSPTKKQERSKSRARAKSRARSRSRSHSHEKSSAKEHRNGNHQSHNAYSSGCNVSNSNASTGNESLLQGLQRVINSNDLEMGLPALKDAIRTIKATNQKKDIKVESVSSQESECLNNTSTNARPMESDSMLQSECLNNTLMNARPMESDSMLLPHERVGIDFSWLQASNQEVSAAVQKEDDLDDEEFLYGREDGGKRPYTHTPAPYASVSQSRQRSAPQHNQVDCAPAPSQTYALSKPMFNSLGDLIDVKQLGGSASPSQNATKTDHRLKQELPLCSSDDKEYEKIQGLLKNFGLNMGIADIGTMMTKIQQDQKKEALTPPPQATGCGTVPAGLGFATAAMGHTGVRHALESLQCLIKATKEKRAKGDPHGRSDSPKTIVKQRDPAEEERLRREKQARMKKIETLLKDLEGLLKDNGTDFMIPVIGFYCQKCEEFIGDLSTAESHASAHSHKDSSVVKQHTDKKMVEDKGHSLPHSSSGSRHPHHSDRKDQRDSSYHRDTVDHRDRRDYHGNQRDERERGGSDRGSDLKHKQDSDPRGHRHEREKIAVREGMMKERLLITVSRGQSPPRSGVKEEIDKAQVYGKHSRTKHEDTDSKGKSSTKESNTQESDDSSDSSDDEKGKSSGKSPKKKKKKKEKKKDKKKKKDSHKKN